MLGPKLLITEVPRNVVLGYQVLNQLSKLINDLHLGRKCLFVIGTTESDINLESISESIKISIQKTGREVVEWRKSLQTKPEIEQLYQMVKSQKNNFFIVLGESYTIEAVKYIVQKTNNTVDWISIPTAPIHDGFASPFIFLLEKDGGEEYYGLSKPPIAIIADTTILEHSTTRAINSGIGILLSKFTSNWDWKLASRLRSEPISDFTALVSDELMMLQANNLKITPLLPNNPKMAITEILKGLIISGFLGSFSNNIRSSYGSEHMFAQALDHQIPGKTLRGERVALGTIMMASLQSQDWRLIRDFYKSAGLAVTAEELGIRTTSIMKALLNAVKFPKTITDSERFYTILGEDGLTEDAALRLMYRTGIIGRRPGLT